MILDAFRCTAKDLTHHSLRGWSIWLLNGPYPGPRPSVIVMHSSFGCGAGEFQRGDGGDDFGGVAQVGVGHHLVQPREFLLVSLALLRRW